MTLGDTLALVGITLAILLYALERAWERRKEIQGVLGVMRAVRDGLEPGDADTFGWTSAFDYDWGPGKALDDRANEDYDAVKQGGYNQVFENEVPTAPLEALIVGPGAGELVKPRTIEAVNQALFQIGVFNQLVRQQTEFWGQHLAEIADENLSPARREAIAKAARMQSRMLHQGGIGVANADAGWFQSLKDALDDNLKYLKDLTATPWWSRLPVYLAVVAVMGTLALAGWQGIEDDDDSPRQLPPGTSTTTTTTP